MTGPLPYLNNPFIMSVCDGSDGSTVPIDAGRTSTFHSYMLTGTQAARAYPVIRGLPGNNFGTPFVIGTSGDPVWTLVANSGFSPDSRAAFLGTTGFHAPEDLAQVLTGTSDSPFCVFDEAGGFTVFATVANKTGTHQITASAWSVTYHNTNGLDHANPLSDGVNNTTSRGRLSDAMVIRRDLIDTAIANGTGLGHVLHMFQVETDSTAGFCHPMTGFEGSRAGFGAEGERIRIKPSVNLTTRGLSPFGLAIARTLQQHGCYFGDNAGNLSALKAQQPGGTVNPWTGLTVDQYALSGITWADFEVITKGWQAAPVLDTGVSLVEAPQLGVTNSGTSCSAVYTTPAVAGQLLVAVMSNSGNTSNATIPSGWTLFDKDANTGGCNATVAYKNAAGGEQTITYTCGTASSRMAMAIFKVKGAVALPTFTQFQTPTALNTVTIPAPITPAGLVISAMSLGTDATASVPGDWTTMDESFKAKTAASNNNVQLVIGDLKSNGGLISPSLSWTGTAVFATGYVLNFAQFAAPSGLSTKAFIGGSYVDVTRRVWNGAAWVSSTSTTSPQ